MAPSQQKVLIEGALENSKAPSFCFYFPSYQTLKTAGSGKSTFPPSVPGAARGLRLRPGGDGHPVPVHPPLPDLCRAGKRAFNAPFSSLVSRLFVRLGAGPGAAAPPPCIEHQRQPAF